SFFWTSMMVSARLSSASRRSTRRRKAAFSSANGSGFGPRFLGVRAFREPSVRSLRQCTRFDEYRPSRRSRAPIGPASVQASASSRMRRLYSAENLRRSGFALTSVSTFGGDAFTGFDDDDES